MDVSIASERDARTCGNVNQAETEGTTSLFIACQNNHPNIVELLLQHPSIDINIPMTSEISKGATPLIIASYLGKGESS